MGARARMLIYFVRNILEELPNALVNLKDALVDVLIHAVLPLVGVMVAFSIVWSVGRFVYRIFFPKTAKELRDEALGCLKQGDDDEHRQEAKALLNKAIQRDARHLPSYLTLASVQLYQEENYKEASKTIDQACNYYPKDEEVKKFKMDISAMEQNPHMAVVGGFASPHLEDAGLRPRY